MKHVSVRFGQIEALRDISLTLREKEIVSIVGPNGGGKTTLIHAILGFVKPDAGSITVLGRAPSDIQQSGRIGYLPQIKEIERRFPVSAGDIVAMSRYAKKSFGKRLTEEDRRIIHDSLDMVGMAHAAPHHFGSLSGGQQQRVLIARALAGEPEMLVLDEPSTGLDAVAQDSFYHLLKEIRDRRGLTILMVSHDIGMVSGFVDRIACLNRQLHYHGKPGKDVPDMLARAFGPHMNVLVHDAECKTCGGPDA